MAVAALSDEGKYYAAISHDGRLKVWDTENNVLKQEYTPDLHLSSPPCCLQWITVSNVAEPSKTGRRKSSTMEYENPCIALGTTNGKLLIYNIAQAKVETVLIDNKNNSVQNSKITCLDWSRKYGLFSCNKNNYVSEWDINSSSVKFNYNITDDSTNKQVSYVSAIKIIPHNLNTQAKYLVSASWQIKQWCLQSGVATVVRNLGHNDDLVAVFQLANVTANQCYLIQGSHKERLLSVWDVTVNQILIPSSKEDINPSKKQRKKSINETPVQSATPSYNFVLEDAPRNIDVFVQKTDAGVILYLGAATRSGVLHYYSHMLTSASTKPVKPMVTVHITTEDAVPMPIQCCKFYDNMGNYNSSGPITVGYEPSPGRVLFEQVIPDTKIKTQVLIRGDPSIKKAKKSKKKDETNKIKSSNASEDKVTYVEPMGGVTRKRVAPGANVEVPMEERLANLAVDVKSRGNTPVNQNLTKLLVQGLHSRDKGILLMVLQTDDPLVAKRTLTHLPADYVPQLLEQLTDMASRKTSQCAAVCTWMYALLRCHSALLLATLNMPTIAEKVTQLLAILTQRRSHLCQLLNVKGRLELIVSQRDRDNLQDEEDAVLEYADAATDEEMDFENHSSTSSLDDFQESEDSDQKESDSDQKENDSDS